MSLLFSMWKPFAVQIVDLAKQNSSLHRWELRKPAVCEFCAAFTLLSDLRICRVTYKLIHMNDNLRRDSGLDGYRHRDKFPCEKFRLPSDLTWKLSDCHLPAKHIADKLTVMLQAQAIMAEYQRVLKFLTSPSPPTTHLYACAHRHLWNLGNLHTALKQDFLDS